jgi:hypothetical protein
MGIAKLYGQSGSGGKINGIIQDYYAYASENISAGDFVEFINGVAGQTTGTSVDTMLNNSTTNAGYAITAVVLDSNRVFIAHDGDSGHYLYGMVVTINGRSITAGTDTIMLENYHAGQIKSVERLENGNVFIAFAYGTKRTLEGIVCEISGTTISGDLTHTSTTLSDVAQSGDAISTELLPNGNVFIAHSYGSSYNLYGIVCTINGKKITAGTDTELQASSYAAASLSTELLPNGNIFIAHSLNSSYRLYALVCSVSGTTISVGTDTSISSENNSGRYISVAVLENNKVFIAHSRLISGEYYVFGIICSISKTTISKDSDQQLCNYLAGNLSVVALNSNKVFIVRGWYESYYHLYGMIVTISGMTITAGTDTQLNESSYSGYTISSILLPDGNIFISHSYSSNYHLYAQIFGIDEANNVPTNNVTIKNYETQVRKATTSDIYGVAKTSGEGGDETGHKDIIRVYQPYPEKRLVMADGNTLVTSNGDVFLLKEAI